MYEVGRKTTFGNANIRAAPYCLRRGGQNLDARCGWYCFYRFHFCIQCTGLATHQDFQLAHCGDQPSFQRWNLGFRGLGLGASPNHIVPGSHAFSVEPFGQFQRMLLRLQVRTRYAQLILKAAVVNITSS